MEIEIFSLCDFAQDNQGKFTVVGTFDTIFSHNTPIIHRSCFVALKFRVANSEAGQHHFEIRGLTPDKEVFNSVKGAGESKPNPNADYASTNLPIPLHNLKFDKFGKYAFELYFDGEFRSGLSLYLVQMPINLVKAA